MALSFPTCKTATSTTTECPTCISAPGGKIYHVKFVFNRAGEHPQFLSTEHTGCISGLNYFFIFYFLVFIFIFFYFFLVATRI